MQFPLQHLCGLCLLLLALFAQTHAYTAGGYVLEYGNLRTSGIASPHSPGLGATLLTTAADGSSLPQMQFVASTPSYTMAYSVDGDLWAWGWTGSVRMLPRKVSPEFAPAGTLTSLTSMGNVIFGLGTGGSVWSWVWPFDNNGTLGSVSLDSLARPFEVDGDPLPEDELLYAFNMTLPGSVLMDAADLQCSTAMSFCVALQSQQKTWGFNTTAYNYTFGMILPDDPAVYDYFKLNYADYVNDTLDPIRLVTPANQTLLALAVGPSWFLVMLTNNSIYGSGDSTFGKLGFSADSSSYSLVKNPSSDSVFSGLMLGQNHPLVVGTHHAMVYTAQGDVYVWGANDHGQLGLATSNLLVPAKLTAFSENVAAISAFGNTSFALTMAGELYVWGAMHFCAGDSPCSLDNAFSLFGGLFPGFLSSSTPLLVPPPADDIVFLSLPPQGLTPSASNPFTLHFLVTTADTSSFVPVASATLSPGYQVAVWGSTYSASSQSMLAIPPGNPLSPVEPARVGGFGNVGMPGFYFASNISSYLSGSTQVSISGGTISVFTDVSAKALMWGSFQTNDGGASSLPFDPAFSMPPTDSSLPVDISSYISFSSSVKSVLPGPTTQVLLANGTVLAWSNRPQVVLAEYDESDPDLEIKCGGLICAVYSPLRAMLYPYAPTLDAAQGTLLGNENNSLVLEALPLNVTSEVAILDFVLGYDFGVALVNSTPPFLTWGASNSAAQLGRDNAPLPAPIDASDLPVFNHSDVKDFCAGYAHVLVLLHNGTLISWGDNSYGQAGEKPFSLLPSVMPASWLPGDIVHSVSCVYKTSFLLTESGKVYAFGLNGVGGLFGNADLPYSSLGSTSPFLVPVPEGVIPVSIASSPTAYSIAMLCNTTTIDSVPASPSLFNTSIIAIGQSPVLPNSNALSAPWTYSDLGNELGGVPLDMGSILNESTIVQVAMATYSRYWVTSSSQIYVSGDLAYMPRMSDVVYDTTTYNKGSAIRRPRLLHDFGPSGVSIVDIQGFLEGAVVLLSNGSVFFWSMAADHTQSPLLFENWPLLPATPSQGPIQLAVSGVTSMSCDSYTCCFISSTTTPALTCRGKLSAPTTSTSFSSPQELIVMSSRAQYASPSTDLTQWKATNMPAGDSYDITGSVFNRSVVNFCAGYAHLAVLTEDGTIHVSGWNDLLDVMNGSTLLNATLQEYSPYTPVSLTNFSVLFATNDSIVAVKCLPFSILYLLSDGSLWSLGLSVSVGEVFDPSVSQLLPIYKDTPAQVSYNLNAWNITKIHGSRVFRANHGAIPYPNKVFVATAEPILVPRPLPPPPSYPPYAAPSVCAGSQPFAGCNCTNSIWYCSGVWIIDSPVTVSNQVFIQGAMIVLAPNNLTIELTTDLLKLTNPANGFSVISMTGCAQVHQPIMLYFPDKDAINMAPTSINVINSACRQLNTNSSIFSISQVPYCKTLAQSMQQTQDPGSGLVQVQAVITVAKNTCNNWWIILTTVLLASLVIGVVGFAVLYKLGILAKLKNKLKGGADE